MAMDVQHLDCSLKREIEVYSKNAYVMKWVCYSGLFIKEYKLYEVVSVIYTISLYLYKKKSVSIIKVDIRIIVLTNMF